MSKFGAVLGPYSHAVRANAEINWVHLRIQYTGQWGPENFGLFTQWCCFLNTDSFVKSQAIGVSNDRRI